jgi:putative thioredoxin
MMRSNDIVEVSESDFEYQVLAYSQQAPVIVDFWAAWCIPCRTLDPLLERLTLEAGGAFRLAKVDVDQNQSLAERFNVRSIPAVKAFRDGRVIAEFSGAIPEPKLREFLRQVAPSPADLTIEKGLSLLIQEEWEQAEAAFHKAIESSPGNPAALLGLARSQLAQGRAASALPILANFPASREYISAGTLLPMARAIQDSQNGLGSSDDPLEAAYLNGLRLAARGNFPAAMDGLLDVLRQNKRFRNGEVRQLLLGMFEVMGDANPLTQQYRQELASVIF